MVALLTAGCSAGETFADETKRDESGEIVGAGSLGTSRLGYGDCFDEPGTGMVRSVDGLPCSTPHDAQVVGRFEADGNGPWPGVDALLDGASPHCAEAAAAAMSALVDVVDAPELDLSAYVPDASAWADGDRVVICWVESANADVKLTFDLVPEATG